jgi:hypothetical protein
MDKYLFIFGSLPACKDRRAGLQLLRDRLITMSDDSSKKGWKGLLLVIGEAGRE